MSEEQNTGPFVEAHQFKGVHGPQGLVLPANIDPELEQRLRQPPPFTRAVSLHFSNGKYFDVQQTPDGKQYLVLDRDMRTGERTRVWETDWICLLKTGTYIRLTDHEFKSLGGVESEYVPPPKMVNGRFE